MKICVAQTQPVTGDIQSNIDGHKKMIDVATSHGADVIIFPELSLTGYEPSLARALATNQDDKRFEGLQQISDNCQITIGAGVPTKNESGTSISMILFQPRASKLVYSKKYLHADEFPFFVSGQNLTNLSICNTTIALAICYEISVGEHTDNALKGGARVYIASVAKSTSGIDKALKTLSETGNKYSVTVMMSNCVGYSDGSQWGGKSSVWNNKGELMGQLDAYNEGIIIIDTETQELIKTQFETPD